MIHDASTLAIGFFIFFVIVVLGISFYMARKAKSTHGYFAAGGQIHWGVNGIAFAGDYLSAASFLGICGMIASYGYDGFNYSIGYLAGWIVALFVVAEPLKRVGKYTFADALDSRYNSRSVQLTAAISTLIVSLFYLIPQMVGAGAIVKPLLNLPHYLGVMMLGGIVVLIVVTAGMASTTYVQFVKGGLLIVCSTAIFFYVLHGGLSKKPSKNYHEFIALQATSVKGRITAVSDRRYTVAEQQTVKGRTLVRLKRDGVSRWFSVKRSGPRTVLHEALSITTLPSGKKLYNGEPKQRRKFYQVGHASRIVVRGKEVDKTGPLGVFSFLAAVEQSTIIRFSKTRLQTKRGKVIVFAQQPTSGKKIMRSGLKFKINTFWQKVNFVSLMIALFLGTASLPHILIRYYTVKSQRDARKSTILAICAIGFFYILTLYMGLGAMVNGVIDLESSNMSAPLLARSFSVALFAVISALAFVTILGTVSGLIVAASGAVAHDFIDNFLRRNLSDKTKVLMGKLTAAGVGLIAIVLGIAFKGMNVSYLVGWAFAVAASANLPAIIMRLFWPRTTAKGISASIVVGIVSALTIILLSPSMFERYGLSKGDAVMPIDSPAILSIPLAFVTLIVVSLLTQSDNEHLTSE